MDQDDFGGLFDMERTSRFAQSENLSFSSRKIEQFKNDNNLIFPGQERDLMLRDKILISGKILSERKEFLDSFRVPKGTGSS